MMFKFTSEEALVNTKTSFGQWLKQRRKALDLTREDLARRVGCAANTIYKIEADERRPSKQIAELLAEHLNIVPAERAAFVNFARTEAAESAVPWGTPFHPSTNLLAQPTVLIGRGEDVAVIRKRLFQSESRLLTLIGPPGIGKTRLALQVAAEVLDDFADGVFYVALAPISDVNLVSIKIASVLGIADVGPQTPLERLKAFLRDKQTLLVLDNFEQILAAAPQIAELLAVCSSLKILVTSRAPLRIRPEQQLPVSPLALPDLVHLPDIESVIHYSAITLFLERAQAVKPDFSLTEENAATVAAICTRLDGLPLAIELISARVKLLTPIALLERLRGRLMLQSDGLRDIEPRHRTLNAAIDWSYDLLNVDEQALLRRLAVFYGWTLEAAEAVCMENLKFNLLDGLASLLDKNLVQHDTRSDGEPRFMMLETIWEYAWERLKASGELEMIQRQHAYYFVALAETPDPILTGSQVGIWWDRLQVELANFRAALVWGQTKSEGEIEIRLALGLRDIWRLRGYLKEGSTWLADALKRIEESMSTGMITKTKLKLRAQSLDMLGVFNQWQGDLDAALLLQEESLGLFRELGDPAGIAKALDDCGILFVQRGDYERATLTLNESLVLWHELGHTAGIANCLLFMGCLDYSQGLTTRARTHWEESLALWRKESNVWVITTLLTSLAMVTIEEGDYERSISYLLESLTLLRELGERWESAHTLEVCACMAATQAEQSDQTRTSLLRSARLFGAAEMLRETQASTVLAFQRHFNERGVASLHAQLDGVTLAAAWSEGRAMTFDQAIAYALNEID